MRLFFAVPAPPSTAYRRVTEELKATGVRMRPVPDGSWHATLRFLGDLADPDVVARAAAAVAERHEPMDGVVSGVGCFLSLRQARVAWAGLQAPGLDELAAQLTAATPLARDPEGGRPFHGHVTLARFDPPWDARGFVATHGDTEFATWRIAEFVLYRSELGPLGPTYHALRTFALGRT